MVDRSSDPHIPGELGSAVSKAASTILKSLSGLAPGSGLSQSIHKSASITAGRKSDDLKSKSSKLSVREQGTETRSSIQADNPSELQIREKTISTADYDPGKSVLGKNRKTRFMRKYPELFRDDVSINPSYTGLGNFPYNVVCRRRFHKNKSRINRRLNREIQDITMMQTLALDGVRVGRVFTVGFHPSATVVKDFATLSERRRLNQMLYER